MLDKYIVWEIIYVPEIIACVSDFSNLKTNPKFLIFSDHAQKVDFFR